MLPLVQMHQVVQTPPQIDHLASFQAHLNPEYMPLHHPNRLVRPPNIYQNVNSPPRAFPIRSSQPAPVLHRITTSFSHTHPSDRSEHSLRRKTPNGTIDNGYDGSLAHLPSGPPPFKHMILTGPSKIFPTAVVHRQPNPSTPSYQRSLSAGNWPSYASTSSNIAGQTLDGLTNSAAMPWGIPQGGISPDAAALDPAQLLQSLSQTNFNSGVRMQPIFVPPYQQNASPTVFSPGSLGQSPLWRGGFIDLRNPAPVTPGYFHQNAAYDSAFVPSQPTLHHGPAEAQGVGSGQPYALALSCHTRDDGFPRHSQGHSLLHSPNRRLEALSLSSPASISPNGEVSSPARFKERALAQAHRTYADLLVYLSQARKAQQSRHGSGSRPSSKMVVFPRPPKHLSAHFNNSLSRPRLSHALTDPTLSHHSRSASTAHSFGSTGRAAESHLSPNDLNSRLLGGTNAIAAEILNHPNMRYPYSHDKSHRMHISEINSPLVNAKAALDVLSSLCEQSGWKWMDGILLGGCLHYGLEHYEEALVWFNRILSLDQNHVEALSNIAATLYSLNRQKEAEDFWMKAIKIRPSYLEAVEHVVGLLCSNQRSEEAVRIISSVQEALRLPSPASPACRNGDADQSSRSSGSGPSHGGSSLAINESPDPVFSGVEGGDQPGFGSSGYAIPGAENGRMLLIIHAKGNMLYALKDVNRASEAFEEAVLISAGRKFHDLQSLIYRIQTVLTPREQETHESGNLTRPNLTRPLLLPPDRAKHTAQLVFSSTNSHLPGLRFVPDGNHRKAAISTTSNCLLSLAKIFQDAMSNGGSSPNPVRQSTGVGGILALYYLSMSLQESPSTANNVGILLASVQQPAHPTHGTEVPMTPNIPGIVPGSGLALALQYYNYGLQLDGKHVHLHTNLGSLLKDIGQLDLAIQMYERAVACDGTFDIALTNLANAVKDRGRINDAIVYYKRAVLSNPDFAEAVCGLSTALNSVCDWRNRGGVLLYGGRYDRFHVDEEGMPVDVKIYGRGSGLMKKVVDIVERQLKDASTWGCGVLQKPVLAKLIVQLKGAGADVTDRSLDLEGELEKWVDRPWEGSRVLRLIERSTRAATHAWYRDRYIHGIESPNGYPRPRLPSTLSVPSAPTVLPFHTFTCPLMARDIRMISQRNALRISCSTLRSPWIPNNVYPPPRPPRPYLNVGYVSSDFNNHPLAHLMQSVFGFHDSRKVKAFCYATTASDRSVHRQQIEREAPVFRDVSTWSSDKLVNQIVEDGIHILVNLNGYTRGARNEVFAARPAPIQMSFMGFAGTLGAEWCDYLLADSTAIPPSTLRPYRRNLNLEDVFRDESDGDADGWVYSENIIFCRNTFFCCDHAQSAEAVAERDMSWEEELRRRWAMRKELFPRLPDDAIILGNFNQLYKIDPTTFRTWLRILQGVPNAYLWLLRFPELGETHLKRTAKAWAGEELARRIIFTDVAPKQQHISRARVCDLFLDTPECNAHTTSADVLWSSTPLLTLPRYQYKMCSRIAASILKGALPKSAEGHQAARELIAADEDEYEKFAIRLAGSLSYRVVPPDPRGGGGGYGEGRGRLAELRRLLWRSKWSCALFDTRRWVRDLEDAYDEAWRRWVDGKAGDIYL